MPNAIVQAQENQKTISIYPTCASQNQWISLDIDHIEKQSIEIVNLNGQSISFELFQNKIKLLNTSQGIYLLKIKNKHDYQTVKILQL